MRAQYPRVIHPLRLRGLMEDQGRYLSFSSTAYVLLQQLTISAHLLINCHVSVYRIRAFRKSVPEWDLIELVVNLLLAFPTRVRKSAERVVDVLPP